MNNYKHTHVKYMYIKYHTPNNTSFNYDMTEK